MQPIGVNFHYMQLPIPIIIADGHHADRPRGALNGGYTPFASLCAAHDALSDGMKEKLAPLHAGPSIRSCARIPKPAARPCT
jgi:hypothetical protein